MNSFSRGVLFIFALCFLLSWRLDGKNITIVDLTTGTEIGQAAAVEIGRTTYTACAALESYFTPQVQNPLTKKLDFSYRDQRISITAFTPFIEANGKRIQMPLQVLFPNGEFYLPIAEFVTALKTAGIRDIEYQSATHRLYLSILTPNIFSMRTQKNDQLVQLAMQTNGSFTKNDLSLLDEKEWVYLDIKGGVFASASALGYEAVEEIFELTPKYLPNKGARLALHLAPHVFVDSIFIENESKQIVMHLKKEAYSNSSILTELAQEREKWRIDTIMIDPGHGGKDPGSVGGASVYEKNIALAIAKAAQKEITQRIDVQVLLTRENDVFIPLRMRAEKANQQGGKLFVSIHVDANRVKSLHGHTIYFMGPAKTDDARQAAQYENSVVQLEDSQNAYEGLSDAAFILAANAQNSYNKESQDFAAMVDREIQAECGSHSYGVRQAGFYVLYGASMPNILIETGFMTNTSDRQKLNSSSYQKSLARAICNAVIKFKERYETLTF